MLQLRREELQETNIQAEEANGIRCNFETECIWEWEKTQNDTFQVVNLNNVSDAGSFVSTPGRALENRGKYSNDFYFFSFFFPFFSFYL